MLVCISYENEVKVVRLIELVLFILLCYLIIFQPLKMDPTGYKREWALGRHFTTTARKKNPKL